MKAIIFFATLSLSICASAANLKDLKRVVCVITTQDNQNRIINTGAISAASALESVVSAQTFFNEKLNAYQVVGCDYETNCTGDAYMIKDVVCK